MLEAKIEEFLADLRCAGKSPSTLKSYRSGLQLFVEWCNSESIDYTRLTSKQARHFRNWLARRYGCPGTINLYLAAASSFYQFLADEELVQGNPFHNGRLRVRQPEPLPRFLTDAEVETVLRWVDHNLPSMSLPYRTMLYSGLRVAEAAGLTARSVVVQEGRVLLRVTGKGSRERLVPVTDRRTATELVERARQAKSPNSRLFKHSYNTMIAYASLVERATGVDFTSHRLRHTFATRLRAQGEELDVIQKLLGHKNIATTTRYAVAPESWERLAARVC